MYVGCSYDHQNPTFSYASFGCFSNLCDFSLVNDFFYILVPAHPTFYTPIPTFNIIVFRSKIEYNEKNKGQSDNPEIKCPGSL